MGAETRNGVKSSSWGLQLQLWLELSLRATHASKWKYVCGWMRTFQRTQCPWSQSVDFCLRAPTPAVCACVCVCVCLWVIKSLTLTFCSPMDYSTPGILSPGVCSNSCPLSWWCHPTFSTSVVPISTCPQSFPASGSFPMSWLFTSGGQSIGTSASASVLPMNIQGWFPLGLIYLLAVQATLKSLL